MYPFVCYVFLAPDRISVKYTGWDLYRTVFSIIPSFFFHFFFNERFFFYHQTFSHGMERTVTVEDNLTFLRLIYRIENLPRVRNHGVNSGKVSFGTV